MFDIITFGSATRDSFLSLSKKNYQVLKSNKFLPGKGLCFSLGSKIEIDNLDVSTGGGGTNTAATFANQGLKVAYIGKIGNDKRGEAVIEELKNFGIYTGFIKKDKNRSTNYSVILSSFSKEKTILVYRGACNFLTLKELSFKDIKAKWFYLAPLRGSLVNLFGPIVEFAKKNNIKVMVNPANSQINLKKGILRPILNKIDILSLNQEEASLLTGVPFQKEKELFKKLNQMINGIAIITKGKNGVAVSDGIYIWKAPSIPISLMDATGAGDALASGFLSGFIKTSDIVYAIQFGVANATSCIKEIGAKNGLLKKGKFGSFPKVKIVKSKL
ncbi:MAG TPA: carbohydrate kinase family protein [bacterium]|nr:carbohydrate kinase family protein [bacterium]